MAIGKVYSLILFSFITGTLSAQLSDSLLIDRIEQNKERLLKIIEQELSEQHFIEDFDSVRFSAIFPEKLPEWINQIPAPVDNRVYLLGISDPGMDDETGRELAMERMKIVLSLLRETAVSNMRDFYNLDEQDRLISAFIDYTLFESNIITDLMMVQIIESYITKYGETVLLGEIDIADEKPDSEPVSLLQVSAGLLSHARGVGTRAAISERINLISRFNNAEYDKYTELSYNAWVISNRINSETILNGENISSLPAMNLRYIGANENNNDFSPFGVTGHSLRHGLWYAYLNAILYQLADLAYGDTIHISSLDEIFDNKHQGFNREIVTTIVGCGLKRVVFDRNLLYLRCE